MRKLLLILTIPAISQAGGFALSGIGNGISFAGAYVAIVNDWTAIYWNPAGLAGAKRQIGIGGTFVSTLGNATTKTGIIGMDGGPYPLKNYPINSQQSFLIPSFGLVIPYRDNYFGFGVYVPFGLGARWDLYSMPIGYRDDGRDVYPEIDHESSLEVLDIVGAYGRKFSNLSIGISLGVSRTSILLRKVNFAILDANGDGNPDLGYPYSLMPVDVELSGSGWGFVSNVGLKFELSRLLIGFALRYNSNAKINGNIQANAYLPKSDYYYSVTNNPIFLGGSTGSQANASTTFKLPLILDFGLGYKLSDKFLLSSYIQYQNWSTFDVIELEIDSAGQTGSSLLGKFLPSKEEFVEAWKGTIRAGLGLEYRLKNYLPIRLGFAFDQSPIPDSTFTPLIPDPGNKYVISAGISREYYSFSYDLLFEYYILPSKTISSDGFNPRTSHNLPGEYKFNLFAIGLGLNYKF